MTLSNFDWTDKESVKWFILLPTGHEGPYSLSTLESKRLSRDVQVWSEGLCEPLKLSEVLKNSSEPVPVTMDDLPPPLPPIPELEIPAVSEVPEPPASAPLSHSQASPTSSKYRIWAGAALLGTIFIYLLVGQLLKGQQQFEFKRLPKMSQALHEKIMQESGFSGWDKKIFFKEYVPSDLSLIWFVTSSFHSCDVEASFQSLKGKVLSMNEDKVAFKAVAKLKNHVAEFTRFEFSEGAKIIPGMYEVDIRAHNCEWDGLIPSLANGFVSPDEEYLTRTRMILFPNGASEFNSLLDKLISKKIEEEKRAKNEEELFWEDLQQKYQTLLAITLQIENLFLEMLDKDLKGLRSSVDVYTKKFGHFLTQFLVANEDYFKALEQSGAANLSMKRTYETGIRMTSKEIGLESMKIIEEFQKLKSPMADDLKAKRIKVKKTYEKLKDKINQKIIQITEDRSAA